MPLLAFALLTIPSIALDYSDAGEPWDAIGRAMNWAIWLAFVAEVAIMLQVVPDRGRWLREHPLDLAMAGGTRADQDRRASALMLRRWSRR